MKVRAILFTEFAKYKHLFPGVQVEAMFVGTLLHSLDHTLMEWNLKDPLWLDVNDPKFGNMAELGQIVRTCFVEDVPGLYFHKRFKESGHPFTLLSTGRQRRLIRSWQTTWIHAS